MPDGAKVAQVTGRRKRHDTLSLSWRRVCVCVCVCVCVYLFLYLCEDNLTQRRYRVRTCRGVEDILTGPHTELGLG